MTRKNRKIKNKLLAVVLLGLAILLTTIILINRSKLKIIPELPFSEINFSPQDRVLILAPHPDDEVLGTAGIIQKAKSMNLPVQICFFTYGDDNELSFIEYYRRPVIRSKTIRKLGLIRHDEAIRADKELGVDQKDVIFLGYPDAGTRDIFYSHWGSNPSYKSFLTRSNVVPYNNAFDPGASYKGESIEKDLSKVIKDFRPTKIFVSHPADQHSDHEALYLFTQIALWDLEKEIKPQVYPYLIHHTWRNWPTPQGYHPDEQLQPPPEIAQIIPWQSYNLSSQQIDHKFLAIKDHKTQYEYNPGYLSSFVRQNELFGSFEIINLKNREAVQLSPDDSGVFMIARLTNFSKKLLFGPEKWSVKKDNNQLIITTNSTRSFFKLVGMTLNVFGYKSDKPFTELPKLRIKIGSSGHDVYDQQKKIANNKIEVERNYKEITIKIPLDSLRNPDRILLSASSYQGKIILDRISWRTLDLPASN